MSDANPSGPSNTAPSESREAAQGQPRESRRSISGAESGEPRRSTSEAVTSSHVDDQIPPPQFRKTSSQTIIRKEVGSSSRDSSRGHPPVGPLPSPSVPSRRGSSGQHPQNKPLPPRPDESPARSAGLPSSRESSGHHPQNKPLPARPVESNQTPIKDASLRNDSPSIFNSTPPENPPGPAIAPRSASYGSSTRNLDRQSSTATPPLIDISASPGPLPRNSGQGSDQKRKLDFNMNPLKPSSEKPSNKPVLRLWKQNVEGQQSSATASRSSEATPMPASRTTSVDPKTSIPWRGPTLEQKKSADSLIDVNGPFETSGDSEKTPTAQQPQRPVFPDPNSPTLKAFKTEPPRDGPGFHGRPAPEPNPDASNRPHVWIRPQRLPVDESQETIETYKKLFSLNQETRVTLLSRAHRYPDYGRDEEAARRKAEFEWQTGETMSDADYYSLFDQTIATDGMISSLMEFMEGREYVKAPYVNRIIHQLLKMMYQSAREESRLRDRRKRECDLLKRRLEDCEKRCGGKTKPVNLDTGGDREKTLRLIKEMWDRMDGVMDKEEECIRDHNHKWRNREETLRRNDTSVREWRALDERFRSLWDERQHLEELIASRSGYLVEDLGRLKDVDDQLQHMRRDFGTWLEYRTNMLIDWIKPIGEDDVDGSVAKLRDIHRGLHIEVALLNTEMDRLKRIADFQREAREVQARSMVDATADSRQPTLPQVSTDGSPPEDIQHAEPAAHPCSGCRSRDDQLREKDRMLKERTKLLKLGVYKQSAAEKQRDKLKEALEQVYSNRVQDALNTIGSYRTLVIDEMEWEMDYLNRLLHAQVGRTKEQADLFQGTVNSLRDKDPSNPVLQELEDMHNSVQRLADTTEATQRSFGQQLDRMVSNRATHLDQAAEPDEQDQIARDGLVTSLRSQVEELTRRIRKMSEKKAHENLKVVDKVRQDMERKISDLQDRVARYKKALQQQRKEVEADLDSTVFRDQRSTSQLFAKEAELTEREEECRRIEGTARTLQAELDKLKAAYGEIEELNKDLEGKVWALQIHLEERNETDRWSLWDGTEIEVTENDDPDYRRQANINKLQRDLVTAIAKGMNEAEKNTNKSSRSASAKFTKFFESTVRKLDKKKADETSTTSSIHETEKNIEAFWRMVDFQRRRAEVVSLIRSSRIQQAKDRLGELLRSIEHYTDYWPDKQHEYEAFRSMHYLQAYVNVALSTIQVRMGEEFSTIARESMATARGEFLIAETYVVKLKERPGAGGAWQAMGRYLQIQTQRSVEELQQCDCKYKTRPCLQHSRDGSAAYYDFMQAPDDQAEMELPRSVQNTLEPYGRSASNYTMDPRRHG
ncbi:hypothetical protein CGCA056_v012900 [Colletotrichum aenigma]|uniref:uncharacterized protein n=1 Tax=Colletotrichum aenigma TaxID=1215731 RepID=UPI0018723D74|nr:uncharacterized protein CGCA056_v012900 [Colletotrichum aenigma]KAF5507320.1 hypothetical protein CGCA056_v012900 [Colletotrichum aenigma]